MRSLIFPILLTAAALAGGSRASALPGAAPPEADAAAPSRLVGLDEAGVRRALGDPSLARAEGRGGVWTYRLPRCALFVYFADAGAGLRVTGVAGGPRRHGDDAPTVETCLADASKPVSGPR